MTKEGPEYLETKMKASDEYLCVCVLCISSCLIDVPYGSGASNKNNFIYAYK